MKEVVLDRVVVRVENIIDFRLSIFLTRNRPKVFLKEVLEDFVLEKNEKQVVVSRLTSNVADV